MLNKQKLTRVERRKARTRIKFLAKKSYPRLSVFRSNRFIYAQIIDDQKGETLASADSRAIKESQNKVETAKQLGKSLAEKATAKGIKNIVFDRGSYKYHGRVKALAEGAREGGLIF